MARACQKPSHAPHRYTSQFNVLACYLVPWYTAYRNEHRHSCATDPLPRTLSLFYVRHPGQGFTTDAFVGRVDAALLLSSPPSLSSEQQLAIEEAWPDISSKERKTNLPGAIGRAITTIVGDADPRTLQVAGATVAAIFAAGVAAHLALGCFGGAQESNEDEPPAAPSRARRSSSSGGSGGGGKGGVAKTARGGGNGGHYVETNGFYEGGAPKASRPVGPMPADDASYATPSRHASSNSDLSGNGRRGSTTPRRKERSEYCSGGDENGGRHHGNMAGDAAQSRADRQAPVNPTHASANSDPGPKTRSRTRAKTGTSKGAD